jgi:hypothetical protein
MGARLLFPLALLATTWCAAEASAAEAMTVDKLLADGYAVVAVMPSPAGPGLFLEKGPSVWACFVSETPDSAAITTRYCKPVH